MWCVSVRRGRGVLRLSSRPLRGGVCPSRLLSDARGNDGSWPGGLFKLRELQRWQRLLSPHIARRCRGDPFDV